MNYKSYVISDCDSNLVKVVYETGDNEASVIFLT